MRAWVLLGVLLTVACGGAEPEPAAEPEPEPSAGTIERLDPDDVANCVAAMAVMVYVAADLPKMLERTPASML